MKSQYTIFYCWQNDKDDSNQLITNLLDDVKQQLAQDGYDCVILKGAVGHNGMVRIDESLLENIRTCDAFVCDLTPVTALGNKHIPNSNVMFELGFAFATIGASQVLGLANEGDYKIEDLPFDINHCRINLINKKTKASNFCAIIKEYFKESSKKKECPFKVFHSPATTARPTFDRVLYVDDKKYKRSNKQYATNESYFAVPLSIRNVGPKMLGNCELTILSKDPSIRFSNDRSDSQSIFNSTIQGMAFNIGNMNPQSSKSLPIFYIKAPHEMKEVYLVWKLNYHEGTISNTVLICVEADYQNVKEWNPERAGEVVIRDHLK